MLSLQAQLAAEAHATLDLLGKAERLVLEAQGALDITLRHSLGMA